MWRVMALLPRLGRDGKVWGMQVWNPAVPPGKQPVLWLWISLYFPLFLCIFSW